MKRAQLAKCFIVFLLGLSLIACGQKPRSYIDLLRNPEVLHKQALACEGNHSSDCEVVQYAEQRFTDLNTERENNPELFGQKILLAQEQLAKMRAQLQQPQNTSPQLQTSYAELYDKLQAMLAIVSLTSPE